MALSGGGVVGQSILLKTFPFLYSIVTESGPEYEKEHDYPALPWELGCITTCSIENFEVRDFWC